MQNRRIRTIPILFFILFFIVATTVPSQAHDYADTTISLVTKAVAAECGEAPFGVQIALAAVIFHRMADPRFGDTAAQVLWSADFLSCTVTGRIALPVDAVVTERAHAAVCLAAEGMDPTGGALWYGGGLTGRGYRDVWYEEDGYLFWGES